MIKDEIQAFIDETGATVGKLSARSGVPACILWHLLAGRRKNTNGDYQDKLRSTMALIRQETKAPNWTETMRGETPDLPDIEQLTSMFKG